MRNNKCLAIGAAILINVFPQLSMADPGHGKGSGNSHHWDDHKWDGKWDNQKWDFHRNNDNHWYGYRDYSSNYHPYYGYGYRNYGYDPIREGVRSGRLSDREARELRRDEWEIREKANAYSADGRITQRERDKLVDAERDFRKDLNHELYDGERRW